MGLQLSYERLHSSVVRDYYSSVTRDCTTQLEIQQPFPFQDEHEDCAVPGSRVGRNEDVRWILGETEEGVDAGRKQPWKRWLQPWKWKWWLQPWKWKWWLQPWKWW